MQTWPARGPIGPFPPGAVRSLGSLRQGPSQMAQARLPSLVPIWHPLLCPPWQGDAGCPPATLIYPPLFCSRAQRQITNASAWEVRNWGTGLLPFSWAWRPLTWPGRGRSPPKGSAERQEPRFFSGAMPSYMVILCFSCSLESTKSLFRNPNVLTPLHGVFC